MTRPRTNNKRGIETRDRIIEEAAKLFYLNGYRETTMRSLASAVGIQHPSLFAYFDGKGDIAAVLLTRYFRGLHNIADEVYTSLDTPKRTYWGNILVFYELYNLTIYQDERFSAFYSAFYEEDQEKVDAVAVNQKILHEQEYAALPKPESEIKELIQKLDYDLVSFISMMLVRRLTEQSITAKEASIYFAAKKIDFKDPLWTVTLDEVIDFYDKYWDMIARRKIDVYKDLFSDSSLDPAPREEEIA